MKFLFSLFTLLIASNCFLLAQDESFSLHGLIEKFPDGYVYMIDANSRDTLARNDLKNGYFTINGTIEKDFYCKAAMLLVVQKNKKRSISMPVALEGGNLILSHTVNGDVSYAGTESQLRFNQFVNSVKELEKSMKDSNNKDSLIVAISNLLDDFILENYNSKLKRFATLLTMDLINRGIVDALDMPNVHRICEEAEKDMFSELLCASVEKSKATWIGKEMIPIEGVDEYNNKVAVAEVNKKYMLIYFWASWCGPCIQKLKKLNLVDNDSKDIEIVTISIDDNIDVWKKSVKELDLNMTNLHDEDKKMKDKYNVFAVPTALIISNDNVIMSKNPKDLLEYINKLE